MAIAAPAFFGMLSAELASKGIRGEKATPMAQAISDSFCSHLLSLGAANTVDSGVIGAGTGTGMLVPGTYNRAEIENLMYNAMVPSGEKWRDFCAAVASAASNYVTSSLQVQTAVAGVSNGAATTTTIVGPEPSAYSVTLLAACAAQGISGESTFQMCDAVAKGLVTPLLTSAQLLITDLGAPVPPFSGSVGTGMGKLF